MLRDPTHVVFYSPSTLRWLAACLGLECVVAAPNVALLGQPAAAGAAQPVPPRWASASCADS